MKTETIPMSETNELVWLRTYISEDEPELQAGPRPAVIVIPGGAYMFLSDREGEPVVKKFFAEGFNCFLLHYTVGGAARFPNPLLEISRAIVLIKENAERFNVDPDRIFVCGFSAGGHLAAAIGTMWASEEAKASPDMAFGMNKPRGMILCYPWITLDPKYGHETCARLVSGGEYTSEIIEKLSCDKAVSENTVPAYIWTTSNDECVHPMNSILMAEAMCRYNIPYELHIFSDGPHGMALCNDQTAHGDKNLERVDCATWVDEAIKWALGLDK